MFSEDLFKAWDVYIKAKPPVPPHHAHQYKVLSKGFPTDRNRKEEINFNNLSFRPRIGHWIEDRVKQLINNKVAKKHDLNGTWNGRFWQI